MVPACESAPGAAAAGEEMVLLLHFLLDVRHRLARSLDRLLRCANGQFLRLVHALPRRLIRGGLVLVLFARLFGAIVPTGTGFPGGCA